MFPAEAITILNSLYKKIQPLQTRQYLFNCTIGKFSKKEKMMKIFLIASIALSLCEKVSANYEFEWRALDSKIPNDDKFLNINKVKVKRISRNETHKLYGEMTWFQGVGEDINFVGELYKKQGGEFRKTVYHLKLNFCEMIKTEKVFWPSFNAIIEPAWPEKVSLLI